MIAFGINTDMSPGVTALEVIYMLCYTESNVCFYTRIARNECNEITMTSISFLIQSQHCSKERTMMEQCWLNLRIYWRVSLPQFVNKSSYNQIIRSLIIWLEFMYVGILEKNAKYISHPVVSYPKDKYWCFHKYYWANMLVSILARFIKNKWYSLK